MRKLILSLFIVALLGSCMYEKGSGVIVTKTKDVAAFTGIKVSGGFEVEIKNGPSENVVLEADDNLVKYVDIKVEGDDLKIKLEHVNVSDAHLKVLITAPRVNRINASAGSEVRSKDELKSEGTITAKASSGSNIKATFNAPEIKADASSGGELTLSGRTKDFHASCSSGSTIVAADLLSENTHASASSGGNVRVYASVSLDASASSGGNISYRGAAPSVKKSESSGGVVEKDN